MGEYSADDRLLCKYMDLNLIPYIPIKIKPSGVVMVQMFPEAQSRISETYWLTSLGCIAINLFG